MRIWVDADACPRVIKEILSRAAIRAQVPTTFVANQALATITSPYIKSIQVAQGFDQADDYIVAQIEPGDLVITADIPFAAEAIEKGAQVISPRGEKMTADNIKARLTMRNFMEEMRDLGQVSGGPPPLSHTDRQAFANALDQALAKR